MNKIGNHASLSSEIKFRDIWLVPNLLSLFRIFLTPFIGYFLSFDSKQGVIICVALLTLAGISDFFDGYFARRLNQISALGMILDPVADKIFTLALIVELVYFRGFPVWLAVAIIARDLLILLASFDVMKSRRLELPSNLMGKYYFATISLLILSYIVHFPFGEKIFYYLTLILLICSSFNYARTFIIVRRGGEFPIFKDRPLYKYARLLATIIIIIIGLYKFYFEVIVNYIQ